MRSMLTNTQKAPEKAGQSPGFLLQRACACGSRTSGNGCESCRDRKSPLQRSGSNNISGIPSSVDTVLNSPGHSLDSTTRAEMESQLRQDFSGVRVHTDHFAADSARALSAMAYTVGNNVVFGSGMYRPRSAE